MSRLKWLTLLVPVAIVAGLAVFKLAPRKRPPVSKALPAKAEAPKYVPQPADDFLETLPAATASVTSSNSLLDSDLFPGAVQQPVGALSGRIVFVNAGHGWVYQNGLGVPPGWFTSRGVHNGVLEDYGNLDQMNLFVPYCVNAGATVVSFRPIGYQTNEVVLDNTSADVSFGGEWIASTSTVHWGVVGEAPYQFALVASNETATATYTPSIPTTDFYPVYTWVRHARDRTHQLYKINHTGGQSLVRVPHHMVGNGWVYLGTYRFDSGKSVAKGSVIISNVKAVNSPGHVVVADAIRFGNGIGDVVPRPRSGEPTKPSGFSREEESAKYWIQAGIGQGQPRDIFEAASKDEADGINAPPRMARQMNREDVDNPTRRVFISFHSNSKDTKGRGAIGLFNNPVLFPTATTPNQERLAEIVGGEINKVLTRTPDLPLPWFDRGAQVTFARPDFSFGEINNASIGDEFDAVILESGYHDNAEDAALLREPRTRQQIARAAYQAMVRYMHEFDNAPLLFLPQPPSQVSARAAVNGEVVIAWEAEAAGTNRPSHFHVFRSIDGYGFGAPVRVPGDQTSVSLQGLEPDRDTYFRVTAVSAAGESLPSKVVGCRPKGSHEARILFVNAFSRLDSGLNLSHTAGPGIGGPNGGVETFDRVLIQRMNSFDYVVPHGKAMSAVNAAFDSCDTSALTNQTFKADDYRVVIWARGQESKPFGPAEQSWISTFLKAGGNLFISGSDFGLNSPEGSETHRSFIEKWLGISAQAKDHSAATPVLLQGTEGSGLDGISFDGKEVGNGSYTPKRVQSLAPVGNQSQALLAYTDGNELAAVQSSVESGSAVVFGFPFESLPSPSARQQCMEKILQMFQRPGASAPK